MSNFYFWWKRGGLFFIDEIDSLEYCALSAEINESGLLFNENKTQFNHNFRPAFISSYDNFFHFFIFKYHFIHDMCRENFLYLWLNHHKHTMRHHLFFL